MSNTYEVDLVGDFVWDSCVPGERIDRATWGETPTQRIADVREQLRMFVSDNLPRSTKVRISTITEVPGVDSLADYVQPYHSTHYRVTGTFDTTVEVEADNAASAITKAKRQVTRELSDACGKVKVTYV